MPKATPSRQIAAGYPVLNARAASEPVYLTADYIVPSSGLAAGQVIEMLGLAEGLVPVTVRAVVERLDTGAAVTLDCGVLTGAYGDGNDATRTCGSEAFAGATVGQLGGVQDANKAAIFLLAPSLDIVPIGFKVATAPAGNIVGARIRLNVTAHAMPVSA